MSVRRQALKHITAALAVAAIIIVGSSLYLNPGLGRGPTTTSGTQSGTPASLIVQLTDPPTVPKGTSSLNMTYSSIGLLAGEPASNGQQTTATISVTPQGGSARVDLLKLQNVSRTIASASLPSGSTIYSLTFTVMNIGIDINGTISPVALATGGSTLAVTLARPAPLSGANVALIQLNPVVVSTPSGYQVIPSAVGIVKAASNEDQNSQVGTQQQLSPEDANQLEGARGNLTATLTALSVSGNTTTVSVQVKNPGNSTVVLYAIGLHGNFAVAGPSCQHAGSDHLSNQSLGGGADSSATTTTTTTSTSTEGDGGDSSTTTTTTTTTSSTSTGANECEMESLDRIAFVPLNSSVAGTSCAQLKMQLVSGEIGENGSHGLSLAKGQCADLTFTGQLSLGQSGSVLVPSTSPGQAYEIQVIASQGANVQLSCTLPSSPTSCSASNQPTGE